jgi:hypothetical protein
MMIFVLIAALLQASAPTPPPHTVDRGSRSGIESARQVAVRSSDAWAALWTEHAGTRERPSVDFGTDMVVGVFLGSRPTAGYSVEIASLRPDGDGLIVQYREGKPRQGMITAQVLTSPFHLVVVPRCAGAVKFEKLD